MRDMHVLPGNQEVAKRDTLHGSRRLIPSAQVVGILLCLACFTWAAMSYFQPSQTPKMTTTYTVETGDTLYGIAHQMGLGKRDDIREVVWEIERLNDMSDATIYPGEVIIVPVG